MLYKIRYHLGNLFLKGNRNRFTVTLIVIVTLLLSSMLYIHLFSVTPLEKVGSYSVSSTLSSSDVTSFAIDKENRIWIGTSVGLNIYEGHNFSQCFYNNDDSTSIPNNSIRNLICTKNGDIWVATNNGIVRYEHNMHFKRFSIESGEKDINDIVETSDGDIVICSSKHIHILRNGLFKTFASIQYNPYSWFAKENRLLADDNGGVWLFTPTYVSHFNKKGQRIHHYPNARNSKATICRFVTNGENVWIAQGRHLNCLNKNTGKWVVQDQEEIAVLPSAMINYGEDELLIKSHKFGLFIYNKKSKQLREATDNELTISQPSNMISVMLETPDHQYFVAFRNGEFELINQYTANMRRLNRNNMRSQCKGHNVHALTSDGHNIWGYSDFNIFRYGLNNDLMEEWPQDLIFTDSPYFRQDMKKIIPLDNDGVFLLSNVRMSYCKYRQNHLDRIFMGNPGLLLEDCEGLDNWVFTIAENNKLFRYNTENNKLDEIEISGPSLGANVKIVALNNHNVLAVAQNAGLVNIEAQTLKYDRIKLRNKDNLKNVIITCVLKDSNEVVWVGTQSHGLLKIDLNKREITQEANAISQKNVSNIVDDGNGNLCITSEKNVYLFNKKDKTCMIHDIARVTSKLNIESFNSIARIKPGIIVAGKMNGTFIFGTTDYTKKSHLVGAKKVEVITSGNQYLAPVIQLNDDANLRLRHDCNDIRISLGENNYGSPFSSMYYYKLEGYDNYWRASDKNLQAVYPNLPPGRYRFLLKRQDTGIDSDVEQAIMIDILSPIWMSWQALAIYVIILMYIIVYINRLYLNRQTDKMNLTAKEQEAERQRQTNEMNMRFFANVSHEFRNPLTLITGPVMTLDKDQSLSKENKHRVKMIAQNAKRMMQLIDQMLDFNKLHDDVLRLQVEQLDVTFLLQHLVDLLKEAAKYHNITVAAIGLDKPRIIWIDKDKLDKIVSNLFTNALKHTPEGGAIGLECTPTESGMLKISISNSGSQIPSEKLNSVFMRYYQVKGVTEEHRYGFGTGIGLNYVKQLVALHKGTIEVKNNVDGNGVSFSFTLPIKDVYDDNDKKIEKDRRPTLSLEEVSFDSEPNDINSNDIDLPFDGTRKKMLIVDDDTAISLYIRSLFSSTFNVKNLYSAEQALEYLQEEHPDIILSDVMMNDMNGLELCKQIKNDISLSHIPIVLISGKSNIKEQIEGLKVGAVAYIVKPFDPEMLKALVESQLNNMLEVRKRLGESSSVETLKDDNISPQDKLFLNQLYELMKEQLDMEDININTVCEKMLVSRTKFNYKIKALTGTTPSNFFKVYKLNCAAKLLKSGECNVKEAAIRTGFSNLPYFSIVFKKQFGVSPSEYK